MRSTIKFLLLIMLPLLSISCNLANSPESNNLATISIFALEDAGLAPVAISLEAVLFNTDEGRLGLFDMNDPETEIPSQLENGSIPLLWVMFDHASGDKTFALKMLPPEAPVFENSSILIDESSTTLLMHGSPVLQYHHADMLPPEGTNPSLRRSAFIHPLWSPQGAVLTHIQPPDHYHHYGIWNPWTSTTIEGIGDVDFWNLAGGQGRVQFGGYLGTEKGPVFAGIKVRQEHVAYPGQDENNTLLAINEVWDVRAWDAGGDAVTLVDLTTTLNSPLPDGILFNAYRYGGGIGYRATDNWTRDNSTVLTSEGKTRSNTDASKARWCIIEGQTDTKAGRSGVLFLSHPSNRSHPEPMRMWDENSVGGRGEIFFQFTPIRHHDWMIEPNKSYTLRYRMIVYDGEITAEKAEEYWKAFAFGPIIHMQ